MRLLDALKKRLWPSSSRTENLPARRSMREFVYLDEVSLRSLLSSQLGEVTEGKSEQLTEGQQLQATATAAAQAPFVSKAEISSRFQTSNSSTLQTSRKATVQSWFREFHNIVGLRLIEPGHVPGAFEDVQALRAEEDASIACAAERLERGELIEFRVRLSADPVFHLSTMASEFAELMREAPSHYVDGAVLAQLKEILPVNRILERLLAGLIPVRAEALDHVVVEIDSRQFVVRREAAASLGLQMRPLVLVGVTEHLAYWKDIRRVLFSEAEFTLLARVARSGLHQRWTAIKLGDLFRAVAPDWEEQIYAASRSPFMKGPGAQTIDVAALSLAQALRHYSAARLSAAQRLLDEGEQLVLEGAVVRLQGKGGTATGQREAFQELALLLEHDFGLTRTPEEELVFREQARVAASLPLFPQSTSQTITISTPQGDSEESPHLLDVEVVAIYW